VEDSSNRPLVNHAATFGAKRATRKHGQFLLNDPAMLELERVIERVAPAAVTVLILGETGVGKELVASLLHERSRRNTGPYVCLNCASLPEPLLESELFGYERGAFTGAVASKLGLLEVCDGGTVFLDEVAELPLALQAKLLRAIEAREVMRIGSTRSRDIDVRFIAATHRDLEREVGAGRLREDLYYRLNCVTLRVPPLRERGSEIAPLARLFLAEGCARFGIPLRSFSAAALNALCAYAWPGNLRQLKNVVERAALLSADLIIEPCCLELPEAIIQPEPPQGGRAQSAGTMLAPSVDPEGERIATALLSCGGNQSRAAKLLGMPRRTLVRKIARLGLPRPRSARASVQTVGQE
jgi:two-component system, NtrC family, response regulator AtoC